MRRKAQIITLFLLWLSSSKIDAQVNLVPNYSFEDTISCPWAFGIFSVENWYSPTANTPDYLHKCNQDTTPGFQSGYNNQNGYQMSFSGVAYCGFSGQYNSQNGREYIQVRLNNILGISKRYCIRFSLSLADKCNCGIDKIGFNFTKSFDTIFSDSVQTSYATYLARTPQFETPPGECIVDKNNWLIYEGSFIAQGGEEYLTIGNFHPNIENTQCILDTSSVCWAYYYIDDVWVYECVYPEDTIAHIFMQPTFTSDQTTLFYTLKGQDKGSLSIYNTLGQVVYRKELDVEDYQHILSVSDWSPGMYIWTVHNGKTTLAKGKLEVVR